MGEFGFVEGGEFGAAAIFVAHDGAADGLGGAGLDGGDEAGEGHVGLAELGIEIIGLEAGEEGGFDGVEALQFIYVFGTAGAEAGALVEGHAVGVEFFFGQAFPTHVAADLRPHAPIGGALGEGHFPAGGQGWVIVAGPVF